MSKEDTIKCFLDCKGEDDGFQLTLTNKAIDVIANEIERLNNAIKEVREYILQHCEIIRFEDENVDKVGKVEGIPILEILDKEKK